MEFTAEQVWACAAAAQRINGGYFKEPVFAATASEGIDYQNKIKEANKVIVKNWLRENNFSQLTEADYAAGQRARDHFKSYTLLAIAGKLNDFQQTAMKLAVKDTFTGRDLYDFAVISCLPSVAERDQQNSEIKREIYASEQLKGVEGDAVVGDITVIRTRYNPEYNKWKIHARMGESFVDFWFGRDLVHNSTLRIKAKIKAQRGDKTTALNYVKITG